METHEVVDSAERYLLSERTPSVSPRQIVCFDSQAHKLCTVGVEAMSISVPSEPGEGKRELYLEFSHGLPASAFVQEAS